MASPGRLAPAARLPRGTLDRARILDAALELCGEPRGLAGLSIAGVAERLGVQATAVHWHFPRRDDLTDAVFELAVERFNQRLPVLVQGADWANAMRGYWQVYREILRTDAGLCEIVIGHWMATSASQPALDASFTRIDALVGVLLDAGFTPVHAARGYHLLSLYTRGCLLNERSFLRDGGLPHKVEEHVDELHTRLEVPHLRQVAPHLTYTYATDEDFREGLDTIIRGLEATLRDQQRARRGSRRRR